MSEQAKEIFPPLNWSPRVYMRYIDNNDRYHLKEDHRNSLCITICPHETEREPTEEEKSQGINLSSETLSIFVKDLSQVQEKYDEIRIEAYRQLVHYKEKQSKEI